MNTFRHFFLLALLLLAAGCDTVDPDVTISQISGTKYSILPDGNVTVEFAAEGGSASVSIHATDAWSVSPSADWCSVSPASGEEGDFVLSFKIAANEGYDARTATARVQCGPVVRQVSITQKEREVLTVDPVSLSVPASGGECNLTVSTNTPYTFSVDEASRSWLDVTQTKSLDRSTLKVTVKAQDAPQARTGAIAITSSAGTVTVKVEQAAADVFTVTPSSVDLAASGGAFEVTVVASRAWHLSEKPEWISQKEVSGSTVRFEAAACSDTEGRSGVIVFCDDNQTCLPVTVRQAGAAPALSLSTETLTFSAEGGTSQMTLSSNTSWTGSSDATWCTVEPAEGKGDGTVSVTVPANDVPSSRSAKITFRAQDGPEMTLTVQQAGSEESLTLTPQEVSLSAQGGKATVNVASNTSWTASSSASWCEITPVEGKGDGTVTLSAGSNADTEPRTATLTVRTSGGAEKSLTVRQAGIEVQLSLSETELSFKEEGGTAKVTVTTDAKWKASSNATWCAVSPSEGTGNGELTLQVGVNYSTATRSATVTVGVEGGPVRTLAVRQSGSDCSLSVSSSEVSVAVAGGTATVDLSSNASWTASSDASWCEVSPASGSGDGVLTLTVSGNDGHAPRSATVTVSASDVSCTINVKQDGPDVFLVTPAYVEISAGGGTFEVTVTTGRAYHISSMPAWVSEVSVDNQVHTFSVGANTSGARTDVIVFCDESGACTPVVVKQLGTS